MSGLNNMSVQDYIDREMTPAEMIREGFNKEGGLVSREG